jgi:hypothetical protein
MEIVRQYTNREFSLVPDDIVQNIACKELDFSNNQITSLQREFGNLLNLKKLNLSKNQLNEKSFPSTLSRLIFLEELNLSNNSLTELPPFILLLPRLRVLHLAGNKITKIPAQISQLITLERLYFGDNQLESIPRQIASLPQLRLLSLANNKLSTIPTELESMHNLVCLQLHNNRLNYLPRGIVELENLQELSLRGNPLINRFVREFTYSPPSLTELAGRAVINNSLDYTRCPREVISRLKTAKCCPNPACGGVYFDQQYKQIKFADFCGRYRMPLLQFLCSPTCLTPESDESSSSSDDDYNPARMRRVLLG